MATCPSTSKAVQTASTPPEEVSACPVAGKDSAKDTVVPSSSDQLSRERVESSIPSASGKPYFYPSERQFFTAATAKGHQLDPADMDMVIAIHNAVNERAWKEILQFEEFHKKKCPTAKLMRFLGRPGEATPKALFYSFFGRTLPFDRHDWYIDRCGTQVRYVVDFYDGKESPTHPISIHIDARPELSVGGVVDRFHMWAKGLSLF